MKYPKQRKAVASQGIGKGPTDNQSTIFLFIIGLLLSVFVMVGNFGAQGFLPFGMIVAGYLILKKANIKSPKISAASGFSVKTLTFIAGGVILVLSINFALGAMLSVWYLQPPLSTQALATSAQYSYFPVYVYTLLFAISETYLFQGVILYLIYSYLPMSGLMLELSAVAGSSAAWCVFHLFVYGSSPMILAFVFFTGVVFGVITIYSNNILAASAIHGINNLIAAGLTVIKVLA